MVHTRQDVDVDPDVLVVERRDRLLIDPARCDGSERRHRDRDPLAEPGLSCDAFGRAQLRVREGPGVHVVLQQSIVDTRYTGKHDVRRRESAQILERQAGFVDVRATGDAVRARGRQPEPIFPQAGAIDLEQLHVDDDFGPRLVDGGNQLRCRGDPLGRVLQRDGVGRVIGDLPDVDDDLKVDNL